MKTSYFTVLVISIALLTVSSCDRSSENSIELTKVSLRQEWFPNCNYVGALFAQQAFAKKYGIEITVEPGSEQIDPVSLVIQGHNTFGDAAADKVLVANSKGADLVVVGVVSYNSPTCFITKSASKIRSPKDFEGHTVGVLTGTNTEYIYRTLVKRLALQKRKIKEVEAPFDLTSFIVSDDYDVRPAYIYDEPVSLDQKGINYNLIEPKNYGVTFLGTVYFTTRETVEKRPDVVQAFVNSIADGWTAALKYPDVAVSNLKRYDSNIDTARESACLGKGMDYFRGKKGKILWSDIEDWEEMAGELKDLGVVEKVQVDRVIDNRFLQRYYDEQQRESQIR